jgi:hypothetical protein
MKLSASGRVVSTFNNSLTRIGVIAKVGDHALSRIERSNAAIERNGIAATAFKGRERGSVCESRQMGSTSIESAR